MVPKDQLYMVQHADDGVLLQMQNTFLLINGVQVDTDGAAAVVCQAHPAVADLQLENV